MCGDINKTGAVPTANISLQPVSGIVGIDAALWMVCPSALRRILQERELRYFDHLARPPVYMPTLCLSEVTLPEQISQALTSIFAYCKDWRWERPWKEATVLLYLLYSVCPRPCS